MFQFLGKKTNNLLGIDIGSTTIKLLELGIRGNQYSVESYSIEPLAAKSVVEKEIKNVEAVGEAISRALKRSHSNLKYAAVAVPSSAVMTKVVQFSASLGEEELEEIVEMEAGRHIPYPPSEVSLDFEILGINQNDPELMDVLLVASRTENVENRIVAVELAGLKAKVVDVDIYTIERAVNVFADQDFEISTDVIAVVDIGATLTSFNVLSEGKVIYSRDEVFGGKQLIDEVSRRYGRSPEEALAIVKTSNHDKVYNEEILEPFRGAVVSHINRALQFFISSTDFHRVDQIILAGGTAATTGLVNELRTKIGVSNIQVANPFENMRIQSGVHQAELATEAPALLTACGLSLRGFI